MRENGTFENKKKKKTEKPKPTFLSLISHTPFLSPILSFLCFYVLLDTHFFPDTLKKRISLYFPSVVSAPNSSSGAAMTATAATSAPALPSLFSSSLETYCVSQSDFNFPKNGA